MNSYRDQRGFENGYNQAQYEPATRQNQPNGYGLQNEEYHGDPTALNGMHPPGQWYPAFVAPNGPPPDGYDPNAPQNGLFRNGPPLAFQNNMGRNGQEYGGIQGHAHPARGGHNNPIDPYGDGPPPQIQSQYHPGAFPQPERHPQPPPLQDQHYPQDLQQQQQQQQQYQQRQDPQPPPLQGQHYPQDPQRQQYREQQGPQPPPLQGQYYPQGPQQQQYRQQQGPQPPQRQGQHYPQDQQGPQPPHLQRQQQQQGPQPPHRQGQQYPQDPQQQQYRQQQGHQPPQRQGHQYPQGQQGPQPPHLQGQQQQHPQYQQQIDGGTPPWVVAQLRNKYGDPIPLREPPADMDLGIEFNAAGNVARGEDGERISSHKPREMHVWMNCRPYEVRRLKAEVRETLRAKYNFKFDRSFGSYSLSMQKKLIFSTYTEFQPRFGWSARACREVLRTMAEDTRRNMHTQDNVARKHLAQAYGIPIDDDRLFNGPIYQSRTRYKNNDGRYANRNQPQNRQGLNNNFRPQQQQQQQQPQPNHAQNHPYRHQQQHDYPQNQRPQPPAQQQRPQQNYPQPQRPQQQRPQRNYHQQQQPEQQPPPRYPAAPAHPQRPQYPHQPQQQQAGYERDFLRQNPQPQVRNGQGSQPQPQPAPQRFRGPHQHQRPPPPQPQNRPVAQAYQPEAQQAEHFQAQQYPIRNAQTSHPQNPPIPARNGQTFPAHQQHGNPAEYTGEAYTQSQTTEYQTENSSHRFNHQSGNNFNFNERVQAQQNRQQQFHATGDKGFPPSYTNRRGFPYYETQGNVESHRGHPGYPQRSAVDIGETRIFNLSDPAFADELFDDPPRPKPRQRSPQAQQESGAGNQRALEKVFNNRQPEFGNRPGHYQPHNLPQAPTSRVEYNGTLHDQSTATGQRNQMAQGGQLYNNRRPLQATVEDYEEGSSDREGSNGPDQFGALVRRPIERMDHQQDMTDTRNGLPTIIREPPIFQGAPVDWSNPLRIPSNTIPKGQFMHTNGQTTGHALGARYSRLAITSGQQVVDQPDQDMNDYAVQRRPHPDASFRQPQMEYENPANPPTYTQQSPARPAYPGSQPTFEGTGNTNIQDTFDWDGRRDWGLEENIDPHEQLQQFPPPPPQPLYTDDPHTIEMKVAQLNFYYSRLNLLRRRAGMPPVDQFNFEPDPHLNVTLPANGYPNMKRNRNSPPPRMPPPAKKKGRQPVSTDTLSSSWRPEPVRTRSGRQVQPPNDAMWYQRSLEKGRRKEEKVANNRAQKDLRDTTRMHFHGLRENDHELWNDGQNDWDPRNMTQTQNSQNGIQHGHYGNSANMFEQEGNIQGPNWQQEWENGEQAVYGYNGGGEFEGHYGNYFDNNDFAGTGYYEDNGQPNGMTQEDWDYGNDQDGYMDGQSRKGKRDERGQNNDNEYSSDGGYDWQ